MVPEIHMPLLLFREKTQKFSLKRAKNRNGGKNMDCDALLKALICAAKAAFGANLTGIYLHGSLAMGCFNPKKSDIDLLVVVENLPSEESRLAFLSALLMLEQNAPAKGIELSVLEKRACKPFRHPCPYVFHFSPIHLPAIQADPAAYVRSMMGTDRDLAAHCMVLHQYGKALYGPPVPEVFGPVAEADYRDSICFDVITALEEIDWEPVSVILNLCRTLAFFRQGLCLSKAQGGQWALEHLPKMYHSPIREALACYDAGQDMTPVPLARSFARYALEEMDIFQM